MTLAEELLTDCKKSHASIQSSEAVRHLAAWVCDRLAEQEATLELIMHSIHIHKDLTAAVRKQTKIDDVVVLKYAELTSGGLRDFLSAEWLGGRKRVTVIVPDLPASDKPEDRALEALVAKIKLCPENTDAT